MAQIAKSDIMVGSSRSVGRISVDTGMIRAEGGPLEPRLVIPITIEMHNRADWVTPIGELTRVEASELVMGYDFDLRSNRLTPHWVPNPQAGRGHRFIAYRMNSYHERQVALKSEGTVQAQRELELKQTEPEPGDHGAS
jgi:hypothetical protein